MNWVFVGAGNMASSLIGGLISGGGQADTIAVIDPDQITRNKAVEKFGIRSAASLSELLMVEGAPDPMLTGDSLGVVIAVKPHIVETVCLAYSALYQTVEKTAPIAAAPLVMSVAAGVRASSMERWLPQQSALVRCMPNTPALLGLGATALYANEHCTAEHKKQAQSLLDTAGVSSWVDQEPLLDAVTALSGSGPAYFFYLIEQMVQAGCELGLDETTARRLAIETAYGAASMARTYEHSPRELRENVTSKGGTTAAALQVFDNRDLPEIVKKAMQAANDRAVELGDQLSPN